MSVSIASVTFLAGLALIVIALLGGGIEVREIKIPALGIPARMLSFATGAVLLALCVFSPGIFPGVAPPPSAAETAVAEKAAAEKAAAETAAAETAAAEKAAAEKASAEKAAAAIDKFNEAHLRQLANRLKIPLPLTLSVIAPSASVPVQLADYVGAWGAADQGWSDNGVHVILIIEGVDETGSATGIYARGPWTLDSATPRGSPTYHEFTTPMTRDGVSFLWEPVRLTFKLLPGNLMRGRKEVANQRGHHTITLHRIE
jgi:hypothetical protein